MTDERPRTTDDPIDAAIDRAARDLMAHEAPADLRARVMARIEQPASGRVWWSPARLGWAGGALVVAAMATYLAWPLRPAPIVPPEAVVADLRPPAPQAPVARTTPAEDAPTEAPVRRGTQSDAARPAAPSPRRERTVAAAAVAEPEPYVFRSAQVVAPLDTLEPLSIESMPNEPLGFTAVAVDPLVLERLSIEPIDGSR